MIQSALIGQVQEEPKGYVFNSRTPILKHILKIAFFTYFGTLCLNLFI